MLQVAREHGVRFDAVQMPLNVMDARYRSFEKLVLPELVKDGVVCSRDEALAKGIILRSGMATALECLEYVRRLPTSVVISGIDRPDYLDQHARPPGHIRISLMRTWRSCC